MAKILRFNQTSLHFDRTQIMGILNVTPNSFSDGGDYYDAEKALEHAYQMIEEGADIIDIGAESTNPKATPITAEEEIARLLPVVKKLAAHINVPISIDTFRAKTMAVMIAEGADIINDVTGLSDPDSLPIIAKSETAVCLMHQLGNHEKMHIEGDLTYPGGITHSVTEHLLKIAYRCENAGIDASRIILDPGFGFDKTNPDQLSLLNEIHHLIGTDYPVLVGVSRKRLIGAVTHVDVAKERLAGNLSAALWAMNAGAEIVRVHDVKATKEAFLMWEAIESATPTLPSNDLT